MHKMLFQDSKQQTTSNFLLDEIVAGKTTRRSLLENEQDVCFYKRCGGKSPVVFLPQKTECSFLL